MMFYDNVFASAYLFYGRFKNQAPHGSAIMVTAWCQIAFVFLVFAIGKKVWAWNTLPISTPILFLAAVIWIAFLFFYYSRTRRRKIIASFKQKTESSKQFWAVFSLINFL